VNRLQLLTVSVIAVALCAIGTAIFTWITGLPFEEGAKRFWFEALGVLSLAYLAWVSIPEDDELDYDDTDMGGDADAIACAAGAAGPLVEPMSADEEAIHAAYTQEAQANTLEHAGIVPPPRASGSIDAGELRTRLEVIKADRVDLVARAAIQMCIDALDHQAAEVPA
jgi:hypothetical protein